MVKDQLQALYTTLLINHVQLLELLHEEAKGKELNDSDDLFEYFNQLMVYLGSLRNLVFSPEETAEKDQLKKELMLKLGINQA